MTDYEIRVFGRETSRANYFNDDAAIRAALRAAEDQPVEVWRGVRRIFRFPPPKSKLAA